MELVEVGNKHTVEVLRILDCERDRLHWRGKWQRCEVIRV